MKMKNKQRLKLIKKRINNKSINKQTNNWSSEIKVFFEKISRLKNLKLKVEIELPKSAKLEMKVWHNTYQGNTRSVHKLKYLN